MNIREQLNQQARAYRQKTRPVANEDDLALRVRAVSAEVVIEWQNLIQAGHKAQANAYLVRESLCDEQGEPVFAEGQEAEILDLPPNLLTNICHEALVLAGVIDIEEDAAAGKPETSGSGTS
ncbi:MAG: hypothetical protein AAGC44_05185 [Planctomycetota bacterium]